MKLAIVPRCISNVYSTGSENLSERPNPMKSIAITQCLWAIIGIKLTHRRISRLLIVAVLFALPSVARAQQAGQVFTAPDDIDYRKANVMSEGVRLTAELYSPKSAAGKQLPTIIMSHGWGGTAALLRSVALDFAHAGYLVIAFDYRGWGASDSRVILTAPETAKKDGNKFTAEVMEIREV